MLRLSIVCPGKTRTGWIRDGMAVYEKRLRPFGGVEFVYTRESRRDDERAVAEEGREILRRLDPRAVVVVLDIHGQACSSEELAAWLERWEEEGRRKVVFVIGGHRGLDHALLARADRLLSLSRLTFPHEMARLLLLEQLYRAWSIRRGSGYHK